MSANTFVIPGYFGPDVIWYIKPNPQLHHTRAGQHLKLQVLVSMSQTIETVDLPNLQVWRLHDNIFSLLLVSLDDQLDKTLVEESPFGSFGPLGVFAMFAHI